MHQPPARGGHGLCSSVRPLRKGRCHRPIVASGLPLTTLPTSQPVPQNTDTEVSRTLGPSEARVCPPQSWWVRHPGLQVSWPRAYHHLSQSVGSKDFGKSQSIVSSNILHSQGPWSLHRTIQLGPHPNVLSSQNPPVPGSQSPPPIETASLSLEWEFSGFQISRALDIWSTAAKVMCGSCA